MQSLTRNAIPVQALKALEAYLWDHHYSRHALEQIVAFAAAEGTPTGSPYLDREDEEPASEVFVEAMGEVPLDHESWGREEGETSMFDPRDDVYTPLDTVRATPPELDDDDGPITVQVLDLAPVCGGAPAPFEPTAEDWEDVRRWSAECDARDQIRRMEDEHNPMWGYE